MSSTWAENRTHISQLWGTGKKVQKENWLKLWALAEGFLWAGLWGLWRAELCSHPEAFAIVSLTLELLWSQEVWPVYLNQHRIFEIAGKPQVPAHRARISVVTFKIAHPKTILKWYLLSTDHLLDPLFLTLPVYNAAGRGVWVLWSEWQRNSSSFIFYSVLITISPSWILFISYPLHTSSTELFIKFWTIKQCKLIQGRMTGASAGGALAQCQYCIDIANIIHSFIFCIYLTAWHNLREEK